MTLLNLKILNDMGMCIRQFSGICKDLSTGKKAFDDKFKEIESSWSFENAKL